MNQTSSTSSQTFTPGIPGYTYSDLHNPHRLLDLLRLFEQGLQADDTLLFERYRSYHQGAALGSLEESRLLVQLAPHVSAFVARLFNVEDWRERLRAQLESHKVVFRFKNDFISRRVLKRAAQPVTPSPLREALIERLWQHVLPDGQTPDREHDTATLCDHFLQLETAYKQRSAARDPRPVPESLRAEVAALRKALLAHETLGSYLEQSVLPTPEADADPQALEHELVVGILRELELWMAARYQTPETQAEFSRWISFKMPKAFDAFHAVHVVRPDPALPELFVGPDHERRHRDGFKLTDRRMNQRQIMNEVDYCLYCHERDKDSCSKGFRLKDGGFKPNALQVPLAGCPLDERISEMHLLKQQGDPLGSLALVTIDNPMAPGTGHRICNDCMKACIFQKQDPVNIPEIETSVLTDIFNLPFGFEIWSFMTRWNPLNRRRPVALPYNGRNVLVVGLGPAGYTLAHYLLNEGFGVVGIDGLKLEPLPEELVGGKGRDPRPVEKMSDLFVELDERVLSGFGGVSEYGITVRWDKNFLTVLYLNLARRLRSRFYGGVRFGGTLTVEDAWSLGFDHIAVATGAGRPTIIDLKNNLIRGIRKASDFLMALQLTGAFKKDNIANLQVELPAVVVGGGLTAIDTCTELVAYYIVQVEKALERHERLEETLGADKVRAAYDAEEWRIMQTFVEHGRLVRAERAKAAEEGREPDLARLVDQWGGVTLAYRKSLLDSPAYRLNHEEVTKSLEEGIRYIEKLNPVEAIPDSFGAIQSLVCERQIEVDGKWRNSGEFVTLPARSLFVAAGTSPNTIAEKERPGLFALDTRGHFFKSHRVVRNDAWGAELEPVPSGETGFFTSYRHDVPGDSIPRLVSFYGDNHPKYAGNVVKAMASAKHGYLKVTEVFEPEFATLDWGMEAEEQRLAHFESLVSRLDVDLVAEVVKVERLTRTIVDVVVRAPLAARHFEPGQFYRLQNYEMTSPMVDGTRLLMEGLALTGAWVDKEQGLLSLIVLEMGGSSRLCAMLKPGERVVVMGPTGYPTEIPMRETVMLAGGGLGNAVLFSIARALKAHGNRVVYFAGYKHSADVFKREEIEAATDVVVWSHDQGESIPAQRPQDRTFHGNIIQAMLAYHSGALGEVTVPLVDVDRIIAIGSDRMMNAVREARHGALAGCFKASHEAIGSINSPMQCMMKEVCAQCLQKHHDPITGKEWVVFSCFNQDQKLDHVDFNNLNARLRVNCAQEKQTALWLDVLLGSGLVQRV